MLDGDDDDDDDNNPTVFWIHFLGNRPAKTFTANLLSMTVGHIFLVVLPVVLTHSITDDRNRFSPSEVVYQLE